MAAADGAKRPKSPRPSAPPGGKHLAGAYVPRLVAHDVIAGVVHSGAGPGVAVAWVAARQLGLITTEQLAAAGVGRGSIRWRLANGALHRVFRGVYSVGHAVPPAGARELAAVLACGERTFVSHRSAAALWRLCRAPGGETEVTVVGRDCRSRPGLRVYQVQELAPPDRGHRQGISVTSPARTVIDLAATASRHETERAIAEALALELADERRILAAADRAPTRAGVAIVRSLLGQPGGAMRTRSGGERALLGLIRAARLPEPKTDQLVAGFTADFLWPEPRLIVEVDGYPFHGHRAAFERDHRRDIVHKDAGYEVLRFTGRQLDDAPTYVATVIARALDRRSRSRPRG